MLCDSVTPDKPSIKSEKEQFATVGEKVQLECIVQSAPKPNHILWHQKHRVIDYGSGRFRTEQVDKQFGTNSILHIFEVKEEDFGNYHCYAVNNYGDVTGTITLVEKSNAPDCMSFLRKQLLISGSLHNLF